MTIERRTQRLAINIQTPRQRIATVMDEDLRAKAHDLDVTVWVGKAGVESVVEELGDQLSSNELVKVKFLRSARGSQTTEALAETLADRVDAELVETRGNTAVYH